jgi:hypothetical protein
VQWDDASEGTGHVEKVTVLAKHAGDTDVITEHRSLYFDVSALNGRGVGHRTIPVVRLPLQKRMNLPWQIGWFHFDELIDNSAADPGLGVSVGYSSPRAKMTIYVYDKGVGDLIQTYPDSSAAKAEYEQALFEFELVTPDIVVIHEHEERGIRIRLYETNDVMSAVVIAPFNGFFFKMRLTWQDSHEKFLVDCAWYTISTFAHLVGQRHGDN